MPEDTAGSTGMLEKYFETGEMPDKQQAAPSPAPAAAPQGEGAAEQAAPPDKGLSAEAKQYRILQKDVGKSVESLAGELDNKPPQPLTDEEVDLLDEYVTRGYGIKTFPLGTKQDLEFQTAPTGIALESDKEISATLKLEDFTYQGAGRMNNVHLVSIYLFRYGEKHTSWPLDQQPQPSQVNDAVLRSRFESIEGWRNRLSFVTSLDGPLVDRIASNLYEFHVACERILSHEGLTDF